MRKIDFGFNGDKRLNSSFSEIEPYNGENLDTFSYEDMDFLVTRIIDSHRGLNGEIDVREVAQDYFKDGSYVTYADSEKSEVCRKLQEFLNSTSIKARLSEGKSPFNILRNEGFPVYVSSLREIVEESRIVPGIVTSIRPEMFKKLKDSKKYDMGKSMFDMQQELDRLYAEVARLKGISDAESSSRGR